MLRALFLVLLLGVGRWPAAAAGLPAADSLRRLLSQPLPDTQRVLVLDELCWELGRRDLPAARRYGEQGLALARRTGYVLGEARCLNDLGTATLYQGLLVDATRYYQQAVQAARRLPPTPAHRRLLCFALMGLGNAATEQRNYAHAEELFREAQAARAAGSTSPTALPDQALLDLNQGNLYRAWNKPGPGLRVTRRALAAYRQLADTVHTALCLRNLGLFHYEQQRLDSARLYWQASLRLHEQVLDSLGMAADVEALTLPLLSTRQWQPAAAMARRALALARAVQAREIEANALASLAEALAGQGLGQQAYSTLRRFQGLNDSLRGAAAARELADLQVRYRVAQQQLHIQGLTQRERTARQQAEQQAGRLHLLAVAAGGLLLALGVFAWFYRRLQRSRAALAASEAALRQSNSTKDQLMSIIGHDLRGPVAAFQQVSPVLHHLAAHPDPGELRELAAELHTGASGLAALLDNLLHWGRAQTGQVLVRPEPLDAAQVAQAALSLFRPLAAAKRLQLTAELPAAPLLVRADADLLGTVLRNLLSNAVKFTPAGGRVLLRLTPGPGPGQATFAVEDSGPGLPPGLLEAELPPSTPGTEGEPGTGLGLSLCRHFVRLLGSELRARSGGPGACLWFSI